MHRIRRLHRAAPAAPSRRPAATPTACADPTETNVVDTVTLGSLEGTPISTPSGYSIAGRRRCAPTSRSTSSSPTTCASSRTAPTSGCSCRGPRSASSGSTANPGLQQRDETFDDITRAPSNGYVTDSAVPVAVGDRLRGPLPGRLHLPRRALLRQARDPRASRTAPSPSGCWPTRTAATRTCCPASPNN